MQGDKAGERMLGHTAAGAVKAAIMQGRKGIKAARAACNNLRETRLAGQRTGDKPAHEGRQASAFCLQPGSPTFRSKNPL